MELDILFFIIWFVAIMPLVTSMVVTSVCCEKYCCSHEEDEVIYEAIGSGSLAEFASAGFVVVKSDTQRLR